VHEELVAVGAAAQGSDVLRPQLHPTDLIVFVVLGRILQFEASYNALDDFAFEGLLLVSHEHKRQRY